MATTEDTCPFRFCALGRLQRNTGIELPARTCGHILSDHDNATRPAVLLRPVNCAC